MGELTILYKDSGTSTALPTEAITDETQLENVQIAFKNEAAPVVSFAGKYKRIITIQCKLSKSDKNTLHTWSQLALTDSNFAANYPQLSVDGDTHEVGFHTGPKCTRIGDDAYRCTVSFIVCQR
jgi:hypothetical protein